MKKQLFLAFACFAVTMQSFADDICASNCSTDCFGFDSVLTFDVGGGYRNDTLKWKVFPASNPGREVEEKWKDISIGVVEANAQFLACEHYLLKVDFDYGWFSRSGSKRYSANGGLGQSIDYKSKPRGNVYDLSGGLGYQFNLESYRISFAPLAGYSYHQQRFKNGKHKDELSPFGDDLLAHNDYKFRWSGPWAGFAMAYQATCELQLYVDYYYHWARFRGTVKEHLLLGGFSNHLKSNRAHGNEVTVGGTYTFCDDWFVGLKFDYKQFCGKKGKLHAEAIQCTSAMRRLDWQSSTVTLDIGYTF